MALQYDTPYKGGIDSHLTCTRTQVDHVVNYTLLMPMHSYFDNEIDLVLQLSARCKKYSFLHIYFQD